MEGKYVILCFDILPLSHLRLEESSAVSESEPEVQKQKAALREAYNYKKKIFSAAAIEKPIPKTPGKLNLQRMTVLKRYVLRLFMSLKYVTANVVDRNNGRIVATASTVEHAIKGTLECGRSCNAKAAAVVGEVLAMRLKVEGLEQGQGRGIHVDVKKEIEKKGFKNHTKVWAIVNALKNNGVKLIVDENDDDTSQPSHW